MKVWQLLACLNYDDHIKKQYFDNLDTVENGRDDVDESI